MIRLGIILLMWLIATAAPAAVPQAQALWNQGAYRQAVASAFEPASAGDPQAQFLLGEAYRLGRSVDPDDFQARDWYLRAARQGDVASAAALGELLLHMRQSRDAVQWLAAAMLAASWLGPAVLRRIPGDGNTRRSHLYFSSFLWRRQSRARNGVTQEPKLLANRSALKLRIVTCVALRGQSLLELFHGFELTGAR